MLRKLTLDQINDWFTIGKTVTNVELLGLPPAFPAEAARDEAQGKDVAPGASPEAQALAPAPAGVPAPAPAPVQPVPGLGRSPGQRSSEMDYINKYRQLEAQELATYRGSDRPASEPGLGEINYMHELLTNMVHKRLQVYPLHSSVTLEEQNNVFLSPVPGYRKIILSTNIAESSVTVPDVKYGEGSVGPQPFGSHSHI
ncbi:Putative ATP-dependent RNA helicase TDRD9 [Tupaia chinensis]|uniref:Putative ATP-dependent RNA helicase TDRD9 n=1 Tax=Tupaia chinensis TaxID=246437 RepID=L9JA30_TUPCH|nr:Putative ATP-dependent RNA helicase TDRD9 [Tupaia chinensis]